MGIIKKLLGKDGNSAEFKAKLKDAQEEYRIQKLVEQRSKSSNERALEREMEDIRQAKIKNALEQINKKRNKEMWKSKKTILSEPTTMLKNDRPILKEKNIFTNQVKIPFTQGGNSMFFKW